MKRQNSLIFVLILLISTSSMYGQQRIFRVHDPNGHTFEELKFGKTPYSGPPFFYFGSTSQKYYVSSSAYYDFLVAVNAAFVSWNNAGPVKFSKSTELPGALLLTVAREEYGGPAWTNPSWNPSTFEILPASASIVLNTYYRWSNTRQDLNGSPPILDVQSWVTHEVGEVHGVAHPLPDSYAHDGTAPTMAGADNAYFDNTVAMRTLTKDDSDGTAFLQLRFPTLYSNLQAALNKASQIGIGYVYIMSNYSLSSNITVPSGANLVVKSNVALNLNGYSIVFTGGTITVEASGSVNPYICEELNGTKYKLHPNLQTGLDAASANNHNIQLLSGQTYQIASTTTVPSNVTLGVPSSAVLSFASGTSLTVNGKLIANGAQLKFGYAGSMTVNGTLTASGSTFTTSMNTTSPAAWVGISINPSSVGSSLTGCTIKYANIGISSSTSSIVLQSNTIQNNIVGISLSYSPASTLIKGNYITGNTSYGIYGTHAYGRLEGNRVNYNTQKGMYFVEASRPEVYNNEMQYNGTVGIGYYNNCVIGGHAGEQNQYNKVIYNSNSGLYAELNCDIVFGYTGNNIIAGNWVYNARAVNNTDITAEYSFWNGEFSKISADATSTIDYIPYRTSPPPPPPGSPGPSAPMTEVNNNGDDPAESSWLSAKSLLREGKYTEAAEILDYVINTYPSSRFAVKSLLAINGIHKENRIRNAKTYLESIKQSKKSATELEKTAGELLVYEFIEAGNYKEAIEESEEIVKNYPQTESEKNALLNLVFINSRLTGDMQAAAGYYAELKNKYPKDEQTQIAEVEIGSAAKSLYSHNLLKQNAVLLQGTLPAKFSLEQNCPNPFNPTTTISYHLSVDSRVSLKIFNTLGQEVATLVEGIQSAGYHKERWDATEMATGLYIYQLSLTDKNGNHQVARRTMLLLK